VPALALVLVVIGALVANRSGEASEFFLPHLLVGGFWTVLNVVLMALRLPPAGLVMGYLSGEGLRWRRCRIRVRGDESRAVSVSTDTALMTSIAVFRCLSNLGGVIRDAACWTWRVAYTWPEAAGATAWSASWAPSCLRSTMSVSAPISVTTPTTHRPARELPVRSSSQPVT
jgi:hypothetical protein